MRPVNSLSVNEASVRYGIPGSTLRGWVRAGLVRRVDGEAARQGRRQLVLAGDVETLSRCYVPGAGRGKRARLAADLAAVTAGV